MPPHLYLKKKKMNNSIRLF